MAEAQRTVSTSLRAGLLLVAGSVAATLVFVELALFPRLLSWLPLKLHIYLDEGIRPLAQSSKRGTLPRDYIALVGDSYAQGRGDWLLSVDADRNPPFHSAHLIREKTGRDVLSFARSGVGSIRGIATEPLAKYRFLEASWLYGIDPPDDIVAYFYEGNDIHDNLLELGVLFRIGESGEAASRRGALGFERLDDARALADLDSPEIYEPDRFRHLVEASAVAGHDLLRRLAAGSPFTNWFFLRFLATTLVGEARGEWDELPEDHHDFVWPAQAPEPLREGENLLRVGGEDVLVERELQAADPDRGEVETRAALHALGQSLEALRRTFPAAGLCLVYVPAPATSYEVVSPQMTLAVGWTLGEYPTERVMARSRELRSRVGALARELGVHFVDATDRVLEASRARVLHGPTDWRHFNRSGYEVLAEAALTCPAVSSE